MESSFYIKKYNIIDGDKSNLYTISDSLTVHCFIEVNMVAYERILKLNQLNIKTNINLDRLNYYYSNRISIYEMMASTYVYSNITYSKKYTDGFIIEPLIMT